MTDQIAIPDEMAQCIKHHWNALHAKRQMTEPKLKFPLARMQVIQLSMIMENLHYTHFHQEYFTVIQPVLSEMV